MPRKSRPAPRCVWCGSPLKKFLHAVLVKEGQEEPECGKPWPVWRDGQTAIVRQITLRSVYGGWVRVRFWVGLWGGEGDNRFCKKECGWLWACDHVPPLQVDISLYLPNGGGRA